MALGLIFLFVVIFFVIMIIVVSNIQGRITGLQQQIYSLKKRIDEFNILKQSTDHGVILDKEEQSQKIAIPESVTEQALTTESNVVSQPQVTEKIPTPAPLVNIQKPVVKQPSQTEKPKLTNNVQEELDIGRRLFQWFIKGNPVAKVAIIILFFGLSYLLKYSIDHSLLSPEIRIMGTLALGITLLVIGWRLRVKNELYAIILQGGAIGVLYFTLFAAFKLYELVPMLLTFALLVIVCIASVMFAVFQRAISLAIIACVGGYLAPILLSKGDGNHIALFSYYLLISSAILAISFWQSWRKLNIIGFIFTFIVALAWGIRGFHVSFYPECQVFIFANMLIYGVLAVLLSVRNTKKEDYQQLFDLILFFSTPLIAYGFQFSITWQWEFGPAFSALGFGLFYLLGSFAVLSIWHSKAKQLALYGLAIGLGFSNLAVPLALTANSTALVWLIEGTIISYFALQQKQFRFALIGVLVVTLGILSTLTISASVLNNISFITTYGISSIVILFNACLWHHYRTVNTNTDIIKIIFIIVAIIYWSIWIMSGTYRLSYSSFAIIEKFIIGYLIAAWIWFAIGRRINWAILQYSIIAIWPVTFLALISKILIQSHIYSVGIWSVSWLAVYASCYGYLYINQHNENFKKIARVIPFLHISLLWMLLVSIFYEISGLLSSLPWGFGVVNLSVIISALSFIILVVFILQKCNCFPMTCFNKIYWTIGLAPIALFTFCYLIVGLYSSGVIAYWVYIPFINPLEESAAFALIMLTVWLHYSIQALSQNHSTGKMPIYMLIFIISLTFLWGNSIILRSLSQWLSISWSSYSLWHNNIVQIAFSLIWTLAAVILVTIANRYLIRSAWFAGAVIQGIVVVKLVFVDSVELAGLMRAFAFIGVALLMLVIGYLAPLPPKLASDRHDENENSPN